MSARHKFAKMDTTAHPWLGAATLDVTEDPYVELRNINNRLAERLACLCMEKIFEEELLTGRRFDKATEQARDEAVRKAQDEAKKGQDWQDAMNEAKDATKRVVDKVCAQLSERSAEPAKRVRVGSMEEVD